MNIFVGNLSFDAKEIDVQRAFMAFGVVTTVAIVMEKKGKKSRGFGFVEMPDEQEAQAAIAQLQGKEILGRPINVMEALSKEPKKGPLEKRNQYSGVVAQGTQETDRQEYPRSSPGQGPVFKRTGKYKEGRRTLSYLKQRQQAGVTTAVPERRYKSNPMRWRKKTRWEAPSAKPAGQVKPWQRTQTESNPWKKPGVKSSSWKKPEGQVKPWQRSENAESRPWKRTEGESKPWEKSRSRVKPWIKSGDSQVKPWQRNGSTSRPWKKTESAESRPWKRTEGESKPWEKSRSGSKPWVKPENSEARPWKKTETKAKPWRKSSAQRVQSGFKKRISFRSK